MSVRVTPRSAGTCAATIAAAAVAGVLTDLHGPLTACLGIALVLVCPGVAPAMLLRPWIGKAEAAAVAVAVSLALAALVGVLIYAVGIDLTKTSLVLGLAGATVVGTGLTAWLAPRDDPGWPISLHLRPKGSIAAVAAAALLAVTAIVTVDSVNSAEASSGFTQLSVGSAKDGGEPTVQVRNHEGRSERYVVRLESDGRVVRQWGPFWLAADARWSARPRSSSPDARLIAVLERARPEDRGRQTVNLTP